MAIISEMVEKDDLDKFKRITNKILSIMKPKEVSEIISEVGYFGTSFYVELIYVLPNDSEFLSKEQREKKETEWNSEFRKLFRDYLGLDLSYVSGHIRPKKNKNN
jgi:hypothetical protein